MAIVQRLIYPLVNEAARCLEENIVERADDVDLAMVFGTGFAPFRGGPLQYADSVGLGKIVECWTACRRSTRVGSLRGIASPGRRRRSVSSGGSEGRFKTAKRRGQSHFAPKTPQNWDSPRRF